MTDINFNHPLQRTMNIIKAPLQPMTPSARWVLKILLIGLGHLISVDSPENLTSTEDPMIIAMNHNGSFETILVPAFLLYQRHGKNICPVSDWMFGRIPVIGWLFRQVDPVFVYNKPSTIGFLNKSRPVGRSASIVPDCLQRLALGKSILIFPEGTRNRDPRLLKKGRSGIGHLALASKRPVLPVGIDFPLRRTKGRIPKFGAMELRVGKPLTFPAEIRLYDQLVLQAGENGRRQKAIHQLTAAITHQVMTDIARLSGKNYPFPKPSLA